MNSEFQFELTQPIKYHANGDDVEATFVTLAAPSYKQMDKCVPLKQAFYRAAASMGDDSEDAVTTEVDVSPDKPSITPEELISLFYQSDEDMVKIVLYGVELFKVPSIAQVDGSVNMTQPLIEKLSQDDIENMLGQYMINFILASALSKTGSK